MCGYFGIISSEGGVAGQIYEALLCLQHRGQDAAGIVTLDSRFHIKKGNGLVRDVFRRKHMGRLTGPMGLGHVRYTTVGGGSQEDAQPFLIHYPYGIAMAHNGNVTNYGELVRYLSDSKKAHLNSRCDLEVVLNILAIELGRMGVPELSPEVLFRAVEGVFERVRGSYSVVALVANYGLLAFRDPYGVRPMIYGSREGRRGIDHAVASENVALDILGFTGCVDVKPGEAILFPREGAPVSCRLAEKEHYPCIFEQVYFARPDTAMDGVSVYQTRRRFGEKLAEKWRKTGIHVDVVIPVPDSSCTAASTLARALGVDYREGLVKNRYIGRTFIMPGQSAREASIRRKLNAIPMEFRGKDVLLVDDSIVRGNTARQIVELARHAGARRVYFASCSPPIRFPCVYGIDMSTREELLASNREEAEVREWLGADQVLYQDLEALVGAASDGDGAPRRFCAACFSGHYPTGDVTPEVLSAIESERLGNRR